MKYTYLLVNVFSVAVPFIYSFHPKIKFSRFFGAYFSANIISAFCFLVWDAVFTASGVWGFSSKYTLGITVLNLPFEEILFFFCIPFACVFTYHCLGQYFKLEWSRRVENAVVLFSSVSLVLIGVIHFERMYTSATFISTGLMLLLFKYVFKVDWLPRIISVYPVLLIPFTIVNGLLTGYGLTEPVVWYNDSENLSIRILTIPIEDVIYGFELIILTIFIYEILKARYYSYER